MPTPSSQPTPSRLETRSQRPLSIVPQPTETTCGPTCLHAVYDYWEHPSSLDSLIREIPEHPSGGTFSVLLGCHALQRGFDACMYSYNVRVFDPTWENLDRSLIAEKLSTRAQRVKSEKGRANLQAYVDFIRLGGKLRFDELTPKLLRSIVDRGTPIIAGLSSTHLYRHTRINRNGKDDDVFGEPEGHFIIIANYRRQKKRFLVADPYQSNPHSTDLVYEVNAHRLINAILLGIVTYDANLLVIEPRTP